MRTVDVQKIHVHRHQGIHEWVTKASDVNLPGFRGYQCLRCHGTAWMAEGRAKGVEPPERGCVDILPLDDRYQHRDYSV